MECLSDSISSSVGILILEDRSGVTYAELKSAVHISGLLPFIVLLIQAIH